MKILINSHTIVINLQHTTFHFDLKSIKIEIIAIRKMFLKALLKML